jgi:hypothetical protein
MTDEPEGDVWIDAPVENYGLDPKFFRVTVASYPFGINGPATATVKFNITAYIKHLIEKQRQ